MESTVIYLVRHAHASTKPGEKRALSPQGRAGAEHLAALLRQRPIVAVYSSPSRRARQTMKPLAKALGLPLEEHDDLRERKLSGEPVTDHAAAVAASWAHPDRALPGGEPNTVAQRRGVAAVEALARRHAGRQIAVGTHGTLLTLILQHYDPAIDAAFAQQLTLPDLYQLTLAGDGSARIARLWDAGEAFARS